MRADAAEPLKLLALDEDDLKIISAHLQDAVVRIADMTYLPAEQRFAAIVNRFDWIAAETSAEKAELRRCRCALRFDRVRRAQVQKIKLGDPHAVAELLAITYEPCEAPSGFITIYFAGGGAIRLDIECIEAQLCDLGAAWRCSRKPDHSKADKEMPLLRTAE